MLHNKLSFAIKLIKTFLTVLPLSFWFQKEFKKVWLQPSVYSFSLKYNFVDNQNQNLLITQSSLKCVGMFRETSLNVLGV